MQTKELKVLPLKDGSEDAEEILFALKHRLAPLIPAIERELRADLIHDVVKLKCKKVLAPEAYGPKHLAQIRILLVDDVVDNLVMTRIFLKNVGAWVDTAATGTTAIAKAFELNYDLILMDIQMPGMDGHQAASVLRQRVFLKPIIALTAHAMREERDRCLSSGLFTAYLTKPIDLKMLYDTIRRLVDEYSPNHTSSEDQTMASHEPESLDPADFGLRVGPMDKFVAELIKTDPELREIRNAFLRNLQTEFGVIKGAFAANNFKLLRERAHVIRGSAGNYGFVDLFDWATSMEEELSRQPQSDLLAQLMNRLDEFSPPNRDIGVENATQV